MVQHKRQVDPRIQQIKISTAIVIFLCTVLFIPDSFGAEIILNPIPTTIITDVVGGFDELDGAIDITTATIGTKTYALIASVDDDGVQIIDITNPATPTITASITDGVDGFDELEGVSAITTVTIGTKTYALIASVDDDGVQIIDITNPATPTATASITDGVGEFDELNGASAITTVTIGTKTYALVASFDDDGVQIIDITNPATPTATASITDGVGEFDELNGASAITTVTIGTKTYALVASFVDDGVQIIDITNPATPTATASITDGVGEFDELLGAIDITTVTIGTKTYALIVSFHEDGVQIIDITNPATPTATASITDGIDGFDNLEGASAITTVTIGTKTYALVASFVDDGVQIIDITNPATPTATASITDDVGGFDELDGASAITTVTIGTKTYALVASLEDNGVQIIDITNPATPTATASITDNIGGFDELDGASAITTVTIGTKTYALIASVDDDGVQIIDITNPATPTATASITDNIGGFDELDGASAITTVTIGTKTYALVASFDDDGVQIIDITNPATPTATAFITDGAGGFDELNGASAITTVTIGTKTYALVASFVDDGVQIIDITNPATPTATASITDGVGEFDELLGAIDITTVTIGTKTYALIASFYEDGVQIIDITNPATPTATAFITDGIDGFDNLEGASAITTVTIGTKTYALVASFVDDGVQIIDITNPATPTATASITDGVGEFDELLGAIDITTVTIGTKTYALVASLEDNGVQIIDITNPATPTATASITDGVGEFDNLEGASAITTVTIGTKTYALIASVDDDGIQIMELKLSALITITLTGANPQTIELGVDYTELGATTDDGSDVSIDSSAYRNVVGTYIITYTATDGTNQATATRTVNVVDTTAPDAPVITSPTTLTNENTITITGTTVEGSTVTLTKNDIALTPTIITSSDGTWSVDVTLIQGANTFTATATDQAGNISDVSNSVTVTLDNAAPIITLTGANPQTIELGVDYTELGATTDDGSDVSIDSSAYRNVVGTYIITYTATDGTNQAIATRTVNVVDTTAPIITLTGANPQTIELGVDYTELGATTDDGSDVSIDSSAYRNVVGTYIITYTATDGTNQATATRTVNIVDTTAPIITLTGANPQTIELGVDYTELGATTDDGSDVSIDSSAYRNVVGTYIITYTATDGTNQATATRTVNVVDTTAPVAPVITLQTTLTNENTITITGTTVEGSTVTLTQNDIALTPTIITSSDGTWSVDVTLIQGANTFTATATDQAGNISDVSNSVTVTLDNTAPDAPVITLQTTLTNENTITITGTTVEGSTVTLTQNDIALTPTIITSSDGTWSVDVTLIQGANTFTATATDQAGNISDVSNSVTVTLDNTAPVAPVITLQTTLTNENTITITGTTVEGSTVTLTQNDNVLTSTVTIDSDGTWSVDVTLIQGANTFTATATDQAGNISDVSNSVTVTLDNAAPIITLTGANPQTIELGVDYTELGATTDDGSDVSIDSSAYRNVVGTYIITYTATDGTNQATATRTVNVVDTTAPIITLTGANPQTIELGVDYTELGATTDDGSVVSIDSSAYRNVVGTYIITYTATDGTNQATATRTVNVVDTTAPDAPVITLQTTLTNENTITITGTTVEGSTVTLTQNNIALTPTIITSSDGTWSVDVTLIQGANTFTATATDQAGNISDVSNSVTVTLDNAAPIITLTGANPQTIELGVDYTELGATTDDGSDVSIDSSAYRNVVGTYIITYTATDGTNQATATRTVNVVDTTAPIITLTGANPQTIELGVDYTELGATTDDGSVVSIDSSAYRNVVGTYIITYTATDGTNQATATRTVNVVDTTAPDAPVITLQTTLTNENTITITGTTVEGSTVTLTQNDIALTPTIITSSDGTWSVDVTLIQGANTFTATATDQAGNISDVSNSVTVTLDNAAPIITLTGANPQTIELGVDYTELGATTDDGSDVSIDSSAYRNVVGTYIITYTATDGTNQATATRTVNVVDTTAPVAPVITLQTTLTNENTITITGTTVEGSTVTLTQNDIALTPTIITSSDGTWSVDVTLIQGANTFTATATDQAGNISDVSNSVTVTLDNTAPVAPVITLQTTLTNENTITITGTTVEGSTVTLTQNDIALTPTIITSSDGTWSVDVTLIQGANTFTATATDQAGNISDVSNSVTVTLDNAAPIITLTGANPQTIELGVDYTELGATTDDGSDVSIDSSAYRNVVGTYIITYTATDGTNQATATRTVNVVDTTAPIITLTGANPQTIELGVDYTELGATTDDGSVVSIDSSAYRNVVGTYIITYTATDGTNQATATRTVNVVDTTAPDAPVITLQTTLTNENTITITGTTVEGSTVTLTKNDIALTPTIITSSDGTWSVDVTLIQGANTFTATATDQAGNISDVSNSVTVTLDNTAPIITLTGANPQTIELGVDYTELGATTDDGSDVSIDSSAYRNVVGTYIITYTATDGTNQATATRTVNVVDTTAPIITLTGANPQTIELGVDYTELGATTDDGSDVSIDSSAYRNVVGTYIITYTATDGTNQATATRTVNIVDTTAPIITLTGANPQTIELGVDYTELGATTDDGSDVSIDSSAYRNVVGTYIITYTATDGTNQATATRTVNVVDTTAPVAPVITLQTTLTNENTITITGTTVEGSTVTLTQNDIALTPTIITSSDGTWSVDVTLIQGANTFTATATDQAGNISDVSNSVTVTLDNTAPDAPVITLQTTLTNENTITITGTTVEGSTVTLTQNDIALTPTIITSSDGTWSVDVTLIQGANTFTATATDQAGNISDVSNSVTVTLDNTAPVAPVITLQTTLTNENTITITGTTVEGSTVTLTQNDNVLTSTVTIDSDGTWSVDVTLIQGANTFTATATDQAGNISDVSNSVTVTLDNAAPIITLTGANPQTIELGVDYTELGATTDDGSDVSIDSSAYRNVVGTYIITYTATDGTNQATATRTVNVVDTTAPIITLTGANPQTIELGVDYTELGATTDDGSVVSIDSSAYRNVVGTYIITYTATDGTNQATATRTVNVVDTTAPDAPVITSPTTLTNENTITITGTTVEGSTVTLTKNDIALTPTIITSSDGTWSVDVTLIQGANTFTATATDQAGNISDVSNSVTVTLDNAAPIITLTGANPQTIELGVDYTELGATTDDGSDVSIDSSAYRNVVGTYIITYTATDGTNQAIATRTVNVVDTTAPIITLTGANPQTIELGVDYTELGATTDDGSDVSIDSSAYRNVVGTYIITYTATDGTNQATATRTVNIVDTTAPIITLTGANPQTIELGVDYTELGATTDDGSDVSIDSSAYRNVVGTYIITYTATDGTNQATATRTVNVVDTTAPVAPVITLQTTLTNENTITITGTTVEGSTVTLTQNDIALTPTIITSSDGTWSVDVTLIQGANTFTATATDQAGNISDVSNSVTVTLDNTAPDAPVITLQTTLTNENTITITGTTVEGSTVTLTQNDIALTPTIITSSDGTWSVDVTLIQGANTFTATATDQAGNISDVSNSVTVTLDNTAPVAPVITLQTTLTNENTITITGTTVEGSTVTLTQNDNVLTSTVTIDSDGTWSVDVTLIQGANTFTATATDQAGNISDVSNSVTVTLDNAAPIITLTGANPQTIELGVDYTELGATTDDGSDVSIDSSAYRNVVGTYIITYTATDGTNQATATRTVNVVDTTAPIITLTGANPQTIELGVDYTELGATTDDGSVVSIDSSAYRNVVGTYIITYTATDGTNQATATRTVNVVDTTAPDAPVITLQTTLTNENTITITGTTVEGSTVTLTKNDIALTPTIITSSDGTWSVDVTLIQGANTFTATATDQAGNISDVSNSVTVTLDNTAPIITLTGANPQTIELGVDYTELGATTDDGSDVSIDSSAYRNVVGTYIITYTATDGTNQATATRTVNVVDTTAPIITLTGANPQTIELGVDYTELGATTDDGSDVSIDSSAYRNVVGTYIITYTATDGTNQATATRTVNIVDTTAPIITLTGANPQTIELGVDYTELGATTDDGSDVSIDSSAYRNVVGTYIITYTATDGTNQATATRTVNVVDTTAPVAPVITLQTTLTNENTITITGTTVEGSTVTLTQNDIALTPTIITSSDGTWSVDVTLIQGANTFTATATDQAGNISDVSNSVTVTLDNTAPVAPVITLQTTLTNENTITITGTTVEGSTVTLTQNDIALTPTIITSSDGTWSVDVTLIQGANTFTATATDQAGNISDVSNSVTVTLDNTAPVAPVITLQTTLTNENTITITGTTVEGSTVTLTQNDNVLTSTVTIDSDGTWSVDVTLIQGANTFTATATDQAGNISDVSNSVTVTLDNAAPIITLTGANPQTIELGVDYTELGATTDDGSDVSIDSSAYRNVVGTYIITYTATDGTNQATATRTVNVVDTTAPIITLTGANPQTIELGVDYTELGATTDDGSVVSIDSSAYRNVVGTYIITYTATDGTNQATATRTVNVVDTTAPDAPVITLQTTLTNENTITITGTTVEGSTVTLTQNDIALTPTIITSSDGTWSVDVTLIQGANTFTATATDQAGNISDVSNSVTVTLDNAAPIITLTGANPQTIELGVDYTELGATTDDGSDVSIDSSAYRNVVGTYIITYTATDGTNQATATRTVNVVDTTAPIITLTGANPQTIELGVDYTELGATTDDGSDVSIDSSAYRNVVGTYIITYTATDGTNQATATRTVNVVDTTAPIITLTGANPQTIELGVDYTELGATTDDGSVVSIDSSAYRNVVGTYIITYTATDGTNQATATRTVNVVDTTAPDAPVITLQTTLTNENTITITGTTVEGSTVTLTQNDIALTPTIITSSDGTWSVDVTLIQGANTFTATATDQAGNISDVSNSVTVTLDNAAPIITLTGANPQTIELGVDYTELGATTDDGSDVSIDSSAYRNVVGTYIITYTATDGTNQATATRTVNVVDTTAPIITLTGANPQTIELGVDYTELGATTDDGSVVSIDSSAYRNVVGTYIITYTATDGTNQATATRTVNIVDTTAPIITLTGANPQTIELGVDYTELGATTDDGSVVSIDSSAYRNVVGTYIITYTATDGTNQATATRTVNIVDTTAPVAPVITLQTTLTNENTITITGTTVEGSTVTLTQNDIALTPTIITSSDGTWSVDVTLIQGANTFTATATDQAGNISDVSNSVTVTLDNTAPVAPVITLQTTLTNENTITITGTTVEGSTVTLTQNDNVLTSTVTIDSDGTWSVDVTLIQGANTFTATATDQAGNISDVSNSVTVTLDNAAPIITLTGANPQTIELGVDYTELGATTDDGSDVSIDSSAYRNVVGTYIITYTATDGTNQATATRTVNVVDTTAPIITLTGANPQTIELGVDYTELGATTDDGSVVSIDSSAYRNVVGTYIITYTATDGTNQATATRTVNVVDTTAPDAPVITLQTTLTNENTITITGTTVEGSTVTLTQNNIALTPTIITSSDGTWSVDVTLIQGANTFTATATDQAGNISDVSNSVTVTLDNAAPIITLTGANPQTIELGVDYTELGATTDDGSDVSIDSSAYRNVVGTYIITYTATDGTNQATATRTVNIVDTTAPIITLTGANPQTIELGVDYTELGATTDDGSVVSIDSSAYRNVVGTYIITYTATDGTNQATATRTVNVVDTTAPDAPVITLQTTLTNENTITITGTTVEGSTVTLTQNDIALTPTIITSSDGTWSVDVTLIQGANTFTATATDQAGNISDVSNSVTVTLDNAAPIITLTGANPQTIELGVDYTELGATTDDGSDVSIDSSAYRNVVGTYIITYTATDGTNQATATRTVNIVDTTAPIITLTGANPQTIELGVDYTELGATTDDGSVVSIDSSAYRNVVGTYIITYTATDGTNQATATRTVNVVDTTAPVAPVITLQTTLTNENTITITGTTVEGSTVTLTQNNIALTPTIITSSDGTWSVDVTLIQGANTFTATATDQAGNISDVSNSVTVTLDNTAPVAPVITLQTTLTNENTITITGTTVEGSTVTLTQNDNVLTSTVTIDSDGTWSVDVTLIQGANTFTATATDQAGNISDVSNSVTVTLDNAAPIITLTGANPQTIELGVDYTELGATTDDGSDVSIDSSAYRNVVGTYIITYTATDGTNQATATRTVNVVDTTAPIITLTGANPQTIELGVDYTELGATTDDGSVVSIDSSAYRNVVGTYIITYTATDGTNQATATRTVNVVDTTAPDAPVITLQTTLTNENTITITGTTVEGSTVTLTQNDIALTPTIITSSDGTWSVDVTLIQGANTFTATATDQAGNISDVSNSVTVTLDNAAPIITLTGANPQTIELGVDYTELGATTDDGSDVSIDSSAYRNVVGTYIITYTATDGTNQATATRTVNIVDTTAPIITLTGANPQTIELGVDYTELGATTDDGSVVSIDSSAYRNVVGTYIITYTATDGTNQATATRTVNVVDTTAPDAPVITLQTTLTNENTITITGTTVEGSTVTLTQNDIALTPTIITSSDGTWSVDVTLIQGANTFTATATDQAGNISDVSNSVTVTLDNTAPVAPVITLQTTLTNENTITITGTTVEGSTVTLTQNDNVLTSTVTIDSDGTWSVDVTLIQGANTFTATATDQAGNISDVSNSVTVTLDNAAPIITLTGANPQTIELGVDYTELGATTDDGSDVSIDSSAYRNVVGTYIITYTATDGTNQATATRTVNVVDTTAPIITLTGANPQTIELGVDYTELGATTDDGSVVSIDSSAYRNVVGTYIITYTATDGTNQATATRTVNVVDTTAPDAPVITLQTTLTNENTITITGTTVEGSTVTLTQNNIALTPTIITSSDGTWSVDVTLIQGANTFTATATDQAGNISDVSNSVTVTLDNAAPIITLTGANPQTIELGVDYTELGATTDDGSDVSIDSSAYRNVVGTYIITYTATDGTNQATATRTVNIVDTTAPIITLTGANPQTIELGVDYTELGATTDDGSVVSIDSSAYRNVVGTYIITYTATDGTNQATATRTVNIVDTTAPDAPVITLQTTLTNENTITITGTTVEGSTVTLTQNNIALTPTIITSSDGTWSVDVTLIQGANTFTATATDQAGNISDVSNSVTVTLDNAAPIITLTGANPQTIELGVDYTELGATTDDGSDVSIDSSAYRNVVGTYIITYTATDGTNQATATRTVNVVDTTAPIITLTGANPQTIESGVDYTELGATTDDGSVVSIDSSAYRNVVGTYIITYTATDGAAGNSAAFVTRTVNVVDSTAPAISITTLPDTVNTDTMTIAGTAESDSAISLYRTEGFFTVLTTTANSNGDWSISNVSLVEGANTFTATAVDAAENTASDSVIMTLVPIPSDLKKSGSNNDWALKPTFGKSHHSHAQIVQDGFSFNNNTITITDNWHTDFPLTSSIIGEDNVVQIKSYAVNPLKWIVLSLGVPRIGDSIHAEADIHLTLNRNYTNPADYDITSITHKQTEGLIIENSTSASIMPVQCSTTDNAKPCYLTSIFFSVTAPLKHNTLSIMAMDDDRRSHTTYINNGVEFTGESLLPANTHSFIDKKSSQSDADAILLTQQDRRYNIWEDQYGYLWSNNDVGSWFQITTPEFTRHNDAPNTVLTRTHSSFAQLIEQESDRATLIFDSAALSGVLPDTFSYDFDDVYSSASKTDVLSEELYIEYEKALAIMNLLYPTINDYTLDEIP